MTLSWQWKLVSVVGAGAIFYYQLSHGHFNKPNQIPANTPHVLVYGIECPQTRDYIKQLKQSHIPYEYMDINTTFQSPAFQEIEPRLNASGIHPANINGPLVDINGRFYIMPNMNVIQTKLNTAKSD